MPVIKPALTLRDRQDVIQALHYFGDTAHPNHLGYTIGDVEVPEGETSESFVANISHALETYNFTARSGYDIRHHATWWIIGFAPGSHLTKTELSWYEATSCTVLAPDGISAKVWHLQTKSGAADLNVMPPSIIRDPVLHPRRSRDENTYLRLRNAIDKVTAELNAQRHAKGLNTIPHVPQRRTSELVARTAFAANQFNLQPTPQNLPRLFGALGILENEWWVDAHNRLFFKQRRRKKKLKSIPFAAFATAVLEEMRMQKESRDDVALKTPLRPMRDPQQEKPPALIGPSYAP